MGETEADRIMRCRLEAAEAQRRQELQAAGERARQEEVRLAHEALEQDREAAALIQVLLGLLHRLDYPGMESVQIQRAHRTDVPGKRKIVHVPTVSKAGWRIGDHLSRGISSTLEYGGQSPGLTKTYPVYLLSDGRVVAATGYFLRPDGSAWCPAPDPPGDPAPFSPGKGSRPGSHLEDGRHAFLVPAGRYLDRLRAWHEELQRMLEPDTPPRLPVDVGLAPAAAAAAPAHQTQAVRNSCPSRLLGTLTGHAGPVRSVAFSPDGNLLASGGDDRTVRLWETGTGAQVRLLTGHSGPVRGVAFSPSGNVLATAGDDGQARLWYAATGEPAGMLADPASGVSAVAFSPDGRLLAAGPSGLAFSPDGHVLATTAAGGQVTGLWDLRTGELVGAAAGPEGKRYAFDPVNPHGPGVLQPEGADRKVRLWRVPDGFYLLGFNAHYDGALGVAFSPDGTLLASVGWGSEPVRLWTADDGTPVRTFPGHPGGAYGVAFSPDGQLLASAGRGSQPVQLWSVASGQAVGRLTGHGAWGLSVAFSPDGALLASSSEDATIQVWA